MSEEATEATETKKPRRPHRRWPRESVIRSILVEENPKRGAAAERFDLYTPGMTIKDYLDAGGNAHDVYHDADAGFIEVEIVEAIEEEQAAA